MKCKRPNCLSAAGTRSRGLCKKHYDAIPTTPLDLRPIAARIKLLRSRGYTYRALSNASGVHQETLTDIANLRTAYVLRETAQKIMAVPIPAAIRVDNPRCSPKTPATGTRRRLQGLMAMGHSQVELGRQLGVTPQAVAYWSRCEMVNMATALRVRELFDRLQTTPGTDKRARTYALRKGWVPAWAWDEEDMDDGEANVFPALYHWAFGKEEKVPVSHKFRELRALGLSEESAGRHLGLTRKKLQSILSKEKRVA